MKVKDIYSYLCTKAPLELQMDFDNSGFLVGDPEQDVSSILVALDITSEVIEEAVDHNVQLIVSHHPVIWEPMKQVLTSDPQQSKIIKLIKNDIAAICMHTNLDITEGGVNDKLMELLGAKTTGILEYTDVDNGCGRLGELDNPMELQSFMDRCKNVLHANGLRFHDAGKKVHKIAVMGGSGGNELHLAWENGCDTYITSDIKYDVFLLAKEVGINLIDADHFSTENPVTEVLYQWIRDFAKDACVFVSEKQGPAAQFYS